MHITTIRYNLICEVSKLSNELLRTLLKEISVENNSNCLSVEASKLFKLYSNDNWKIGLDRFSDIRRSIELEILNRIELDKF